MKNIFIFHHEDLKVINLTLMEYLKNSQTTISISILLILTTLDSEGVSMEFMKYTHSLHLSYKSFKKSFPSTKNQSSSTCMLERDHKVERAFLFYFVCKTNGHLGVKHHIESQKKLKMIKCVSKAKKSYGGHANRVQ